MYNASWSSWDKLTHLNPDGPLLRPDISHTVVVETACSKTQRIACILELTSLRPHAQRPVFLMPPTTLYSRL